MAAVAVVLGAVLSEKIRSDAIDDLVEEAVGSSSTRVVGFLKPEDLEFAMTGERYDRFHRFVQDSIVSDRTARIKLWASDGTVIYSNDPQQVGDQFPTKPGLMKALDGETPIEIKVPKDPDNELERHLGTLMEIYVPIVFPGATQPAGAFEIYQYYGPTAARVDSMRNWLFGGLGVGFSVLYVGLVFIVWGGWKTINAQRSELESLNSGLETKVETRSGELAAAQDQMIRSEKLAAIGELSGGMAHDLRNPLGSIKNANYMLKKRLTTDDAANVNPDVMKYIEIIDHQVERSNNSITDLMNFANMMLPNVTETNLGEVLAESLENMDKSDGITFLQNIDPNLHPVMADGEQLQRVFLNLAKNAQEAMPGGGTLTIAAKKVNDVLEVTFSDTGEGISDENMGRIFDPLFTTKVKGTGLGLAVCQGIIERHGGTINAHRNEELSGGITFEIRIPEWQPREGEPAYAK